MDKFIDWLAYADNYIYVGLIILVWFILLFKNLDQDDKWIMATMFVYIVGDTIASVMAYHKLENLWLYNLMLIPQFILVMIVMVRKMKNANFRNMFVWGCIVILFLHMVNMLFVQGFMNFNNYTYIPAVAWMAASSFFFLREQMEKIEIVPFQHLITWFALATLIDNAGSLPIVSLLGWDDFLTQPTTFKLYDIVAWIYISKYLIILTGMLWTKTSLRSVFYSR